MKPTIKNTFLPLTAALESAFGLPLDQLSAEQRTRVEQDLCPLPWDSLSAEQRRIAAGPAVALSISV